MYLFFGVAILCVLQQVTGDCSSYCLQKENVLYKEDRETEKPVGKEGSEGSSTTLELVNACSFGCRMAVIDEMLSCPLPANLTACLDCKYTKIKFQKKNRRFTVLQYSNTFYNSNTLW